jgi:hypothetical protein
MRIVSQALDSASWPMTRSGPAAPLVTLLAVLGKPEGVVQRPIAIGQTSGNIDTGPPPHLCGRGLFLRSVWNGLVEELSTWA